MENRTYVSVLCVEDNQEVAEAICAKLSRAGGFEWRGWLPNANDLISATAREQPNLVLLDVDMPGRDPFEALEEFSARFPASRAVMFSGHVRSDLIERALDAGAWGYVSKNDGEDELVMALRLVASGEIGFSSEARKVHDLR